MAKLQLGPAPVRAARRAGTPGLAVVLFVSGIWLGANRPLSAETPGPSRANLYQATTSLAARQSALRSIPVEKLDDESRAKVKSVLSNITVFRRMPVRVVACDPNLYLFLLRHPDVVVNIWEVLKISSLRLRQIGLGKYELAESHNTLATVEFLYRSHDTHVIYAEGSYDGPLFVRPVKGQCLMVLKNGYVREPDGRYHITTRLDTFVSIERGGVELLTKTFHPLMGKTADMNFTQTIAFLGSLSRTAEVNSRGVQRLASKLFRVTPESRLQLAKLAAAMGKDSTASSDGSTPDSPQVASHGGEETKQ